ncbi:NrfD/PsrC family molybdoenzyme membrane anchor subunit [Escherichia coli]
MPSTLFLIGISAGLVTLAVLLRRFYPQAGGADSTLLRTTLIVGPGRGDPRSVDPRLPPDKTVDLLEADVPLQFLPSVMSMGVMLFQLYMVVLVLWLAKNL